jgi:hypothetical protein
VGVKNKFINKTINKTMAKKLATQILKDSQDRQLILDQLNQTVQTYVDVINGDQFDATAKTAAQTGCVAAINLFRTAVEARLFAALSLSYTNTTYVQGAYMVASPVPKFDSIKAIQMYYSNKLALMIAELTLEATEDNFVNDGLGQGTNVTTNPPSPNPIPKGNAANITVAKGATWTTGEDTLITTLGTLKTALTAYVPL